MANELVHATVGTSLTQIEFEAVGLHVLNSQATGDLIYASSSSQLSRLGIGSTNKVLTVIGGVPTWQSTLAGLTLTSPTINGTIATTGLTLPAVTLGGDISLGANKLKTTNLLIREGDANTLWTRNAADNAHKGFLASNFYAVSYINIEHTGYLAPSDTNTHFMTLKARDTDVGLVEIARLQGAADPYFAMGGSQEFKFYFSGIASLSGAVTFSDTVALNGVTTLGASLMVNSQLFNAGAGNAEIQSTAGYGGLIVKSAGTGAAGARLDLYHNSSLPATGDIVGTIRAIGKDSAPAETEWAKVEFLVENVTHTAEAGKMRIQLMTAGDTWNEALRLSSAGVLAVDLAGSGTPAQVDLFDDYDDALVLRQGIQENNRELLANMGVLERKDTGSGYMMKLQPMVRLLAGGIYQTRELIDNMQTKIETLENKLMLLGAG